MQRKLQEVILSVWLERKYSKDEILDLYLNRVYFGSGAYGVEAAAQRYFGKSARNVTLSEAALLAGLVKSPSKLAPTRNYDGAERRAQIVLAAMSDAGFVSDDAAKTAMAVAPKIVKQTRRRLDQLRRRLGDGRAQRRGRARRAGHRGRDHDRSDACRRAAEKALLDELDAEGREVRRRAGRLRRDDAAGRGARAGRRQELRREPVQPRGRGEAPAGLGVQAVRLSHRAGARADARHRARRQADRREGLEAGELHATNISAPCRSPRRWRCRSTPCRCASRSKSAPQAVVRTAHRLGIASKLEPNASIALGTSEVSVMELVSAYVPFANGGIAVAPHVIDKVRTAGGKLIYKRAQSGPRPRHRRAPRRDDEPDDAGDAGDRHRAQGRRSAATRPPARPAPARISATPGSSATPAIWSPACGSAMTTIRRPRS